jgi:hypothetical protein
MRMAGVSQFREKNGASRVLRNNGCVGREAELNALSNASGYAKFFSRSHNALGFLVTC